MASSNSGRRRLSGRPLWQWLGLATLVALAIVAVFALRSTPSAEASCSTAPYTPLVVTDHPNYFPDQTVQIDGCGFQSYAYATLPIRVTRPGPVVDSGTVMPNAGGNFTYYYLLDGVEGSYLVEVFNASKTTVLASTTFVDGSVNLDQCANGNPFFVDRHCDWQNGNINASNSQYAEAEMIPYRLFVEGLDPTVNHTITIEHDFTQGGVKAFDFLTTWNNTQTGATPCSGMAAVPSPCPPGGISTFAFPGDSFDPSGKGTLTVDGAIANASVSRNLTIYNGSIVSISAVTHTGNSAANSEANMVVTFTANSCGTPPCDSTVELLWAGHVSSGLFWGTGNGAASITGSPFHMRTQNLDGGGAANQDRSVQLSAIANPTPTPTSTNTPVTPTNTPVTPTNTPVTPTNTPVTPTNTPVTPTNTPVTPTNTPVTPTNTPVTPTNTPVTPTNTPVTPTNTPVTPTNTPVTPTNTPIIQASPTSTQPRITPTATPVIVGGISRDVDQDGPALETTDGSGHNAALLGSAFGVALAGVIALGGVTWYARRRLAAVARR